MIKITTHIMSSNNGTWLFGKGNKIVPYYVCAEIEGRIASQLVGRVASTGVPITLGEERKFHMTLAEFKINGSHYLKGIFGAELADVIRKAYDKNFIKTGTIIANTFANYQMMGKNAEHFVKVYNLDISTKNKIYQFQTEIIAHIKRKIVDTVEITTIVHNNVKHYMFSTCSKGIKTPLFAVSDYYYEIEKFSAHLTLLDSNDVNVAVSKTDGNITSEEKKNIILGKILKAQLPTLMDLNMAQYMKSLTIGSKSQHY